MHDYPQFLIVGMMKAGTSTIYEQLARNPHVQPAMAKELHFFSADYVGRREDWMFGHEYGALLNLSAQSCGKLHGEASPSYVAAPQRLAAFNPNCKIILMLRDPVKRSMSNYWHEVTEAREGRSIDSAFHDISERHPYIRPSIYTLWLERLFQHFPGKNIFISSLECYIADPQGVMDDICMFLGIDGYPVDESIKLASTAPGQIFGVGADDIIDQTRTLLEAFFVDHRGNAAAMIEAHGCHTCRALLQHPLRI